MPSTDFIIGGNVQAVGQAVTLQLDSTAVSTVAVQVSGTFSATLIFEQSADAGLHYTTVATITATGLTSYPVAAMTTFRVRCSAYASGVASVNIQASSGVDTSSSGGGSSNVNITGINSNPPALSNPLPVELSDGTNPFGTVSNPLSVSATLPVGQAVELLDSGGVNKASISAGGALKVDGSAVTQPVSGTVTAAQATAANLKAEVILLDSGGTNLASVSATGALKVDGSAVTQPVSGTVTVTQGTAANLLATVTQAAGDWNDNIAQVGGSTVTTAAAGELLVGIEGHAAGVLDAVPTGVVGPASALQVGYVDAITTPGTGTFRIPGVTPPLPTASIPPTYATAGATAAQVAQVVTPSPNSGMPAIVQKVTTTGTGSQASLQSASFTVTAGNTIVVSAGTGSVASVAVTDTLGHQYVLVDGNNSNLPGSWIFYASNIKSGSNQVTVTPSGSTSIAFEVYEVSGIVSPQGGWPSTTTVTTSLFAGGVAQFVGNVGTSTSPNAVNATILGMSNLIIFVCLALATTNSTPTTFQPYNKDSDQVIGGTPSGLVGFHSFSASMGTPLYQGSGSLNFAATITSAPWSVSAVAFMGLPPQNVAITAPTTGNGAVQCDLTSIVGVTTVAAAAGIQKVGISGATGVTLDAPIGTTAPTRVLWDTLTPATASAAATTTVAISSTAQLVVKASAGNLYGCYLLNLSEEAVTTTAEVEYIHFFNTTTTTSLSTTNWLFVLPIPAPPIFTGVSATGAAHPLCIPPGGLALANFSNGIVVVMNTTSASSTTASGTAPVGVVWIK
jgi:hypothetical protein